MLDALPTELLRPPGRRRSWWSTAARTTPPASSSGPGTSRCGTRSNRGQGDALRTGFALALERKAAIVVTMDADGQHRPEDLPELLAPILADEADYVQGSRYLGEYDDAGGARDLGIRVFTRLINATSGAGITDCTNGFRAIRGESLARLRLEEPRFSAAELIMESARQGLRIREVSGAHPVPEPRREQEAPPARLPARLPRSRSSAPGAADASRTGVTRPQAMVVGR